MLAPGDEVVQFGINSNLRLLGGRELATSSLVHQLDGKAKGCRDGNRRCSPNSHILQVVRDILMIWTNI